MDSKHNSRSYFAKALAMVLVCCITLFLVQVVVHTHAKGHNEAACRVCHIAHVNFSPAAGAFLLHQPLADNGRVQESSGGFHKEFFANDSPSRAPPVA
jgi:hypothetical protein